MTNKDGIRWLTILELESSRGDWIHSRNRYSIDRVMDKLSLNGPDEKVIALSVYNHEDPDLIVVWVMAKLINGAWMFTVTEEQNVLA